MMIGALLGFVIVLLALICAAVALFAKRKAKKIASIVAGILVLVMLIALATIPMSFHTVEAGEIAVRPIDICGALTLKNRYRSGAMLVFVRRRKEAVILDIVSRALEPKDKTCRILSLDDEYRNEELCDLTLTSQGGSKAAGELAAMLGL